MKNGRINERNSGVTKLDGGAKRCKNEKMPYYTDEQYVAAESVNLCDMVLRNGYQLFDNNPDLINHWIKKNYVVVKEVENPWRYARQFNPTIRIAYLKDDCREKVEFVKDLLISIFNLGEKVNLK